MMKRVGQLAVALMTVLSCVQISQASERPNIIFIMSDDHATNAISAYGGRLSDVYKTPNIDKLAAEGIRLDGMYASNSICTPSRATILTGQYSHVNGVKTLGGNLSEQTPTLAHELQGLGYQTAVIGKWHIKSEPYGFDYYKVLPGQGDYFDPKFKEKGQPWQTGKKGGQKVKGYVTDLITDFSLDWLEQRDKNKPFMLMLHHKAPHGPWQPAERHQDLFANIAIPEPASLRQRGNHGPGPELVVDGVSGFQFGSSISRRWDERSFTRRFLHRGSKKRIKTENGETQTILKPLPELSKQELDAEIGLAYQTYLKNYLSTVSSVDESVGEVMQYLKRTGLDDNTIVVYTSDQGMMLGEHDYGDKRWIYEESSRMPFIVRFPERIKAGSVSKELFTNADIAPTLLEMVGQRTPDYMQGKSFAGGLYVPANFKGRDAIYYRYWLHMAHHYNPAHYGIRTKEHKLVFFYGLPIEGKGPEPTPPYWEMYDMKNDPFEMNNIYHDRRYQAQKAELKAQLLQLKQQVGDLDGPDLMKLRKEHW